MNQLTLRKKYILVIITWIFTISYSYSNVNLKMPRTVSIKIDLTKCKPSHFSQKIKWKKTLLKKELSLKYKPYSKGKRTGISHFENLRTSFNNTKFTSSINIFSDRNTNKIYVYIMLRSGNNLKRKGIVKTISKETFSPILVKDNPIVINNQCFFAALSLN